LIVRRTCCGGVSRFNAIGNPLILLNEIEKAATNLLDALLPFLASRSASKYHDIFVQVSVNLSGVIWGLLRQMVAH
jgi:ATP-dependent Lon protease